jgi:hypothetical protein
MPECKYLPLPSTFFLRGGGNGGKKTVYRSLIGNAITKPYRGYN